MGLSQTLSKLALDLGSGSKLLKGGILAKRWGGGASPLVVGTQKREELGVLEKLGFCPFPKTVSSIAQPGPPQRGPPKFGMTTLGLPLTFPPSSRPSTMCQGHVG